LSDKVFIDADTLLLDSFKLARKVFDDGFIPTHCLTIWRGGSPIGIAVLEFFRFKGIYPFHTIVKTESYKGRIKKNLKIEGLSNITERLSPQSKLLVIDDIFDTGKTVEGLIKEIKEKSKTANIKVATVFFKPDKNQTNIKPDYFVEETDSWVVFPHEIEGLTLEEIEKKNIGIFNIISR